MPTLPPATGAVVAPLAPLFSGRVWHHAQLLCAVRPWWPNRPIVAVADSTYAALELLAACGAWGPPVTVSASARWRSSRPPPCGTTRAATGAVALGARPRPARRV